jgi:hypothetical protein
MSKGISNPLTTAISQVQGQGTSNSILSTAISNTEGISSCSSILSTMTGNNTVDKPGHIINRLKMLPVSNVPVSQYSRLCE